MQGITRELLTGFCATWNESYPSSITRAMVKGRLGSFLRYGYQAEWLSRVPQLPVIHKEEPETRPLTAAEYEQPSVRVLTIAVHALIQLMRWSGLAVQDACTLLRDAIHYDASKRINRIVAQREKTRRRGTGHVSVPIPEPIAQESAAITNDNAEYVFWTGVGAKHSAAERFGKMITKVFDAAGIPSDGHMVSHRLRDTFAVDLLEKGVPLEEVSKLLGHESIRTTEKHYAKWSAGRQDRLDALVTGTWETKRKGTKKKGKK